MKGEFNNEDNRERFHVYQFFEDGQYERVRQFVLAEEAVKAAQHFCTSVAARIGITVRVIITDMGDVTCFEWIRGKGIVWPPKQSGEVNSDDSERTEQ